MTIFNLKSPLRSELFTVLFWREVLNRVARQGMQTALAALAVAQVSGGLAALDFGALALFLLGTSTVTVLRALIDLRADDDAPLLEQAIDRAAAAFAGALLGIGTIQAADLVNTNWPVALSVAGGAAAMSVLHLFVDPPSLDFELAA